MPGSPSVATRLKPHLSAILIALLVICYVDVFLAVRYADKLPDMPSDTRGLDVEKAWGDLHQITRRPHPYNSHENDFVQGYLLRRLRSLSSQYPHIQYTSDTSTHINTTYIDPPHSAYFESMNIIVLVPGLDAQHAQTGGVLYSAHIDSVASGVGATDDGVGVVAILGLIEYFAKNRASRSVVFNLNNGEEDGLNGAMAFFKHPWSTIPDTFINFEGSGAGGRPIFFRSTSVLPLRAAKSNTHAHANVLSGDAFEHRLLRSRTDFTVYSKSLPAPHLGVHQRGRKPMQGIDLAFYKHRSYYHTKYDAIPFIEGGKKALWAMMDAGRGVGWELANRPFPHEAEGSVAAEGEREEEAWGDAPVFFDLFNRHLVVFSRSTLFKLNMGVLFLLPLLLSIAVSTRRRSQRAEEALSPRPPYDAQGRGAWRSVASCVLDFVKDTLQVHRDIYGAVVSPEGKLFWRSLFLALIAQAVLVGLYSTFNPFVVYGRAYHVLASFFFSGIVVFGLCAYNYTPSASATLASIAPNSQPQTNTQPNTTNTQPITRLLLNGYILTYLMTALAAVLVYKAGLGGTYFLSVWGAVGWGGVVGEVWVGGWDLGGVGLVGDLGISGDGEKGGQQETRGREKNKEKSARGKEARGKVDEPVELRRSMRRQVVGGAAEGSVRAEGDGVETLTLNSALDVIAGSGSSFAATTTITTTTAGATGGNASPKKRGRPAKKRQKREVYKEVPHVAGFTSSSLSPSNSRGSTTSTEASASDSVAPVYQSASSTSAPVPETTSGTTATAISTSPVSIHVLLMARLLQLFITVMIPVVLMGHVAQLLVDGMSQTLADGSRGEIIYAALALLGGLLAIPAAPWILAACFDDASMGVTGDDDVATAQKSRLKSKSDSSSHRSSSRSHSHSPPQSQAPSTSRLRSMRRNNPSILFTIPLAILVVVFHEIVITNLTAFPFDSRAPLKVFFQQQVEFPPISASGANPVVRFGDLDDDTTSTPKVTTLLVGVPAYIREVVQGLPSTRGKEVRCAPRADRKGTVGCEWDVDVRGEGVPSSGVRLTGKKDPTQMKQTDWFDANVTRTGAASARFEVKGANTRNCRLYFERPITGFGVERVEASSASSLSPGSPSSSSGSPGSTSDAWSTPRKTLGGLTHEDAIPGFGMPREGVKQLNMWSRTWGAKWVVDVQWPVGEDEGAVNLRGRVACEWSEYDSARAGQVFELEGENGDGVGKREGEVQGREGSSIPAFEEVLAFVPRWVSVSKLYHGMLEVGREWEF